MNLQRLLIDVCKRAPLKKIPRLTVCKGLVAQTRFGKIRIGRRLCSHLSEAEMEGVIAHEVYHANKFLNHFLIIVPGDVFFVISLFVLELFGLLTLLREFPVLILYVPVAAFQAVVVVSIVLLFLVFQRFINKAIELRADSFAASMVSGRTFASALKRVYSIPSKPRLRARIREWFYPHPPLNKRLEAIRNVRKQPYPARRPASVDGKARPE